MDKQRVFLCGTRAVYKYPDDTYRVVCATCGTGASVAHHTLNDATSAAVRDSGKRCQGCGAS